MTVTLFQRPKSLTIPTDTYFLNLIIAGQGVIIFDASNPCTLDILDAPKTSGLTVNFTAERIIVTMIPSNEPLIDTHSSGGIIRQQGAYYWFSLDSQNRRLSAGIGEARKENTMYEYTLPPDTKPFLESLVSVESIRGAQFRRLLRDPITRTIPLIVKDTNHHTMSSIAQNAFMPNANLTTTSQTLYDCISGKRFVLDTPDFPDFSKAIEYSIATPGKWCHERLKAKANEFSKEKPDPLETYLRITLGENNGESPGIPYVMEIWPAAHYSPIHNHGGASAIIRVLHGEIRVRLFPFLSIDTVAPFATADFKKDDVTWISPTLNQVHQLINTKTDTCITIQCYMYEATDRAHYDYFDYVDANMDIKQFEPDSDMGFIEFKETVKKEWLELKKRRPCFPFW